MSGDSMAEPLIGAIEAGGTKFICGIGNARRSIETCRIATSDVDTTLHAVTDFFRNAVQRHGPIAGPGIGSFGPLDLDPRSPGYGRIAATPKPGWKGADLPPTCRRLADALGVPVRIHTDVATAALAEARFEADAVIPTLAYVTIGTGVGVGIAVDGRTRDSGGHPEMGHIPVRVNAAQRDFAGICPYHGNCLEGVASGPAIKAFWGASLDRLPADHLAHDMEAWYIGQLCATLILTVAPDRIVLGGA